jgi:predicted nucleotidyltransferase
MYTIRPNKPINPIILKILAAVQDMTQALGCDYLLVGATARDILMTHVFGIASRRATHDGDFAVAIETGIALTHSRTHSWPAVILHQLQAKSICCITDLPSTVAPSLWT